MEGAKEENGVREEEEEEEEEEESSVMVFLAGIIMEDSERSA